MAWKDHFDCVWPLTGHVIYNQAYTYKFQLKTTQEENKDFDNYENFNQDDLRDPDMTTIGTGKSDIHRPEMKEKM